jgi:hypothetical protein
MAIVFSSADLLNIQPGTSVNDDICYGIKTDDCPVRPVFTPKSTTFIATKYANVIHIYSLAIIACHL